MTGSSEGAGMGRRLIGGLGAPEIGAAVFERKALGVGQATEVFTQICLPLPPMSYFGGQQ